MLVALLVMMVSYNQSAVIRNHYATDKLVPENVRLSNASSSGRDFAQVEKTVNSFMRKWSIAGASVAVSVDGKLVYARGFGFADTASG